MRAVSEREHVGREKLAVDALGVHDDVAVLLHERSRAWSGLIVRSPPIVSVRSPSTTVSSSSSSSIPGSSTIATRSATADHTSPSLRMAAARYGGCSALLQRVGERDERSVEHVVLDDHRPVLEHDERDAVAAQIRRVSRGDGVPGPGSRDAVNADEALPTARRGGPGRSGSAADTQRRQRREQLACARHARPRPAGAGRGARGSLEPPRAPRRSPRRAGGGSRRPRGRAGSART